MEIEDNINIQYLKALSSATVVNIPTRNERALYLFNVLGFPKKLLCSGKGKIISYSSFKRAILANKKGYNPGIPGRRSRLNVAEEETSGRIKRRKEKGNLSNNKKNSLYFNFINKIKYKQI
jgi:hypothetical protein